MRLENVLKTSWRRFENFLRTSWRCLEDVLRRFCKTSWRRLGKTSWKRLEDVWPRRVYWSWSRHLEDILKTSSEDVWIRRIYLSWWRRLEDVYWRRMSNANIFVFKTSLSRRMFAGKYLYKKAILYGITGSKLEKKLKPLTGAAFHMFF